MMRGDQLMIGDFVLVDGKPRRVEQITKKKIGYHLNPQTAKRLHYARPHDVEPILITYALLHRNEIFLRRKFSEIHPLLRIYEFGGSYLIGIENFDKVDFYELFRAEFLHELQHAFSVLRIYKTWIIKEDDLLWKPFIVSPYCKTIVDV